jgi:hypothetical protein
MRWRKSITVAVVQNMYRSNTKQESVHMEVCIWYIHCQCELSYSALTITKHMFGITQYSRVKMAIQLWCSHVEVSDPIWHSRRRSVIRPTTSKRNLMQGCFSEYYNQWRSLVFWRLGREIPWLYQQELLTINISLIVLYLVNNLRFVSV